MLMAGIALLPLIATDAGAQEAAPSFSVLYTFTGGVDGGVPFAGLTADEAGNLYGTTSGGGNTGSPGPFGSAGCRVVFKLDRFAKETVPHAFTGGADGATPQAGLIRDEGVNLYGTASIGGNTSTLCPNPHGCGVVFKLDPFGNETVLHAFTGGVDGGFPVAGPIRDEAGNLYGITPIGGNTSSSLCGFGSAGCGVVFKVDPSGKETVLHAFTGGADGGGPQAAGLIRDADGNLYGTTAFRGNITATSRCGVFGCGVVFKLDPSGKETVLYTFTGGADGNGPFAGLIRDDAGKIYSTTDAGGNTSSSSCPQGSLGCGVVFKVDPSGRETVLYAFTGGAAGVFRLRVSSGTRRTRDRTQPGPPLIPRAFRPANFSGRPPLAVSATTEWSSNSTPWERSLCCTASPAGPTAPIPPLASCCCPKAPCMARHPAAAPTAPESS
jgi:uncharacterized repeat protein (TIGR03803 family)